MFGVGVYFSKWDMFDFSFDLIVVFKRHLNQCSIGLKTQPGFISSRQSWVALPTVKNNLVKSMQLQGQLGSFLTLGNAVGNRGSFLCGNLWDGVLFRGITTFSKKGKRKTCKAVAKRFVRTGKGKLKRWRCGKHHNQTKKTNRRKRFLRKPTYASKTQLKKLNKMLNGW